MLVETFWFLSAAFAVLAMMPAAAHVLELPNKIRLSRDEYHVAQKLYRGWRSSASSSSERWSRRRFCRCCSTEARGAIC